jgi:hypothetical protein
MPENLQRTAKRRTLGFDRAINELNAVLMVLAIGLGVLDATCFIGLKVRDSLPVTGPAGAAAINSAAQVKGQPLALLMPSRPTTMGW